MKKLFIKLFVLTTIIVLFLFLGNKYFENKEHSVKTWSQFYSNSGTDYDVVIMGNSVAYSTFDPRIINSKSSLKSYNLSSASISVQQVYFNLMEMLKYSKPQLLVVEAYALDVKNSNVGKRRKFNYKNIDGQKLSFNKMVSIYNVFETKTQMMEAMFPTVRNHSEWSNFEFIEKNAKYTYKENPFLGFRNLNVEGTDARIAKTIGKLPKSYEITEDNKDYFKKIVALCKENDIKLVLARAPQFKHQSNPQYVDEIHTVTNELIKGLDVKYIDFDKDYAKNNFVKSDFYDALHLNRRGAVKATDLLIEVIENNLDLEKNKEIAKTTPEYLIKNIASDNSKQLLDEPFSPFEDITIDKIYIQHREDDIYNIVIFIDKKSNIKKIEDYKFSLHFEPVDAQKDKLLSEAERKRGKMVIGATGTPLIETSDYYVRFVSSKQIPATDIKRFTTYLYNSKDISKMQRVTNFKLEKK